MVAQLKEDMKEMGVTVGKARHVDRSGTVFRAGILLDFVWLPARVEGPHRAHVW